MDKRVRGLKNPDEMHQAGKPMRRKKPSRTTVLACALGALAASSVALPQLAPFFLAGGLAAFAGNLALSRRPRKHDPQEIFFVGNDRKTGDEVWLTEIETLQQTMALGTTGSGKTETLLGTVFNALAMNSGAIYVDGRGDVSLYAKANAMAKLFGREDDLLFLNFMKGHADLYGTRNPYSNTFNPFALGSPDSLASMVVSLMDEKEGSGYHWKGRAMTMFIGVMRALCWLRDQDLVAINVGTIRDYLNIKAIIDLASPQKYPEMPDAIRKSVTNYLNTLPDYKQEKEYRQVQAVFDQHGVLEMSFAKILGTLADVYGHIFLTSAGEVNMEDVVLNRRILIVALPALEKSSSEVANLGRLVVASLRAMVGSSLFSPVLGSWEETVERRPIQHGSPFFTVFDDFAYYVPEGTTLFAAASRDTRIAHTFAGQDMAGMVQIDAREVRSIASNTGTKMVMRQECIEDEDVESARYGVDASAIRNQRPGEMFLVRPDKVIAVRSFYANPEGQVDKARLRLECNRMVRVVACPSGPGEGASS